MRKDTNENVYWLQEGLLQAKEVKGLESGGILIVGSGLSGVSVAYWLQQLGCDQITIVDYEPKRAASFRNCGHILHGTVESMQALVSLYGKKKSSRNMEI